MAKPVSVTVLGVLNVAFGALRILGAPLAILVALVVPELARRGLFHGRVPPALTAEYLRSPVVIGLILISLVSGIILVIAGIGLLQLKPWGRILSIVWAMAAILSAFVTPFVRYMYATPPATNEMESVIRSFSVPVSICCGLIYPVILLMFMYRSNVVDAFKGVNQPSWEAPYVKPPPSATPPGA